MIATALFLVSLAVLPAVKWWKCRHWGLPVTVTADRDDPSPEAVCGYLAEIACRLDERPERMRVAFDCRNARGLDVALDLEQDGALRVRVGEIGSRRLDLRGRWIADHSVPLSLRREVLYLEPVDGNRFRAMPTIPFAVPGWVYLGLSLAATAGMVLVNLATLAAVAGFLLGRCLSNWRKFDRI